MWYQPDCFTEGSEGKLNWWSTLPSLYSTLPDCWVWLVCEPEIKFDQWILSCNVVMRSQGAFETCSKGKPQDLFLFDTWVISIHSHGLLQSHHKKGYISLEVFLEVCVCVCVWSWSWSSLSPFVGFRRWNKVLPGLTVSISTSVRDHSSLTKQFNFVVLRVLFQGLFSGSSPNPGLPPNVLRVYSSNIPWDGVQNLSEVLLHLSCWSNYHWWCKFDTLQLPRSLDLIFDVLVFGHFLDFCII